MIKIAPSILSADFTQILKAVKMLEDAGADYIHCDVMDGSFVQNISFGQQMISDIRKHTKIPLDVHLMISNPEMYVVEFARAGADIVTVHVETTDHLDRLLQLIRNEGKSAGVSLNLHTPLNVLDYILHRVDMVLLMSVNPGFGGQQLQPVALEKALKLREMISSRGLNVDIEMDGGINTDNVSHVIAAGVNVIVSGSAVFESDNPKDVISKLRCSSMPTGN